MTLPVIITITAISVLLIAGLSCEYLGFKLQWKAYKWIRFVGAAAVLSWAVYSIVRFASGEFLENGEFKFSNESFGFVIFWILFPPCWFFFEFFIFTIGAINDDPFATTRSDRVKDFAGFSSKVWAGILAVLLFYISAH